MITRIFAAVAVAIVASSSYAAVPWTSFKVGKLNSAATYSANVFTVRPDGRFLYAEGHELYSQNTFGSAAMTKVNRGSLVFDPSFVAVRNLTTGLIGIGGFAASGVHAFDPSQPATAITPTALGTLQNYGAVWWEHPTSGRSGWILAGTNTLDGKNSLSFLSADGTHSGQITEALCDYSAGLATDAAGNVYIGLSEDFGSPNVADSETVLKYTATQIDAAVATIITGPSVLLTKASAGVVFQFGSAASIAVDGLGRVWAAGYLTNDLQAYDPASGVSFHVKPTHAALSGAKSAPTYQVQTFTRNSIPYVAFLANDSFFTKNSDMIYGYAAANDIHAVSFTTASQTLAENGGAASFTVKISPTPTTAITVPLIFSGTATRNADYACAINSVVFQAGDTTKTITLNIINDGTDEVNNNETAILSLGAPTPAGYTVIADQSSSRTLTITDDDMKPAFAAVQNFGTGRVGGDYAYQVAMLPNTNALTMTYTAKGLPLGMSIDLHSGLISGRPTIPGEYDEIVITVTNSAGVSVSSGFSLTVEDYAAPAHGTFVGLLSRASESSDLGGRLDVVTTAAANFTGKATVGKNVYPISGKLNTTAANPVGNTSIKMGANTYALQFTLDKTTGAVTGSFGANTSIAGWHCQSSTALTGLHNFALDLTTPTAATPEGTGFGSATVAATALTTITGKTGDGNTFTSSASLGVNGELPIHQVLYIAPGSLHGFLALANNAAHTITGTLDWTKPTQTVPATQTYLGGWLGALALTADGGKYRPVSGSTAALGMVEGSGYDALLSFADGGLSSVIDIGVLIQPAVAVTIAAPKTLVITNATGAISGKFMNGSTAVTYTGLLIPTASTADLFDTTGAGYFVLGTRTGSMALNAVP